MAPEPFVPAVLAPARLITVIEETTDWERLAVTFALLRTEEESARQISEVPDWAFVRTTRVHVKPAPVTLWTEVLGVVVLSAVMKASKSSCPEAVVNAGVVTVFEPEVCGLAIKTSRVIAAVAARQPNMRTRRLIAARSSFFVRALQALWVAGRALETPDRLRTILPFKSSSRSR
jgi:hypothetical protein